MSRFVVDTLPDRSDALRKLALRAGYQDKDGKRAEELLSELYQMHTKRNREIFLRVCQAGAAEKA